MCRLMIAIVAFGAMLAWPQDPRVPANPSSPVTRLDKGIVVGNTYKNASLGLELTPDPKLKFKAPELAGKPGTLPLTLMAAAWGKFKPYSAREGTVFSAIALASYPENERSTHACMRRIVEANLKDGLKPTGDTKEGVLGGVSFARTDFFNKLPAFESVFVRACDAQVLVFMFSGADQDAVNSLIAATDLKLDLPRSGCGNQN